MDNKITILYITNDLEIGGVQRLLIDLVHSLNRMEFVPKIALVCGQGPLVAEIQALGLDVLFFPCIRRNRLFKWLDPVSIIRLACWIRRNRISICHTHLFLGNLIGRTAAFLARCPIIISTEHNTYYDKGVFRQKLDRYLARLNFTIVTVTEAVAQFTSQQERLPRDAFTVIYNGINTDHFDHQLPNRHNVCLELGIPADDLIVGSVGRLVTQKDFPLVLQVFSRFNEHNPNSSLVIVGDGDQRNKLEQEVRLKQIAEKVHFVGFQQDVRSFLSIFDLFITTPIYEGLGLVILEAMMMGVPVVAARVGGIPEVIISGETGLLVDSRDPDEYVAAMHRIIKETDLREHIVEQARLRVREHFSLTAMVRKYEQLYRASNLTEAGDVSA
ncbi:MAG: glycosyltransferase [Anaerolineaceae bacterium]|nr:glycosyltransferase [Anaerolineaceae bacterium]